MLWDLWKHENQKIEEDEKEEEGYGNTWEIINPRQKNRQLCLSCR